MMKKYLDYLLWASGWIALYVLTKAAWKFAYNHFGWDFSETAFLFGFLLAVIGMTMGNGKKISSTALARTCQKTSRRS